MVRSRSRAVSRRKSQAAVELLLSYGWAIIIVLILISALAYYGVLNPSNLLPARCVLSEGLSCSDVKFTANSVALRIQNSGQPVAVQSIRVSSDALAGPCSNRFQTTLRTGESAIFVVAGCDAKSPSQATKGFTVLVDYARQDSPIGHTATGEALLRNEPQAGGRFYGFEPPLDIAPSIPPNATPTSPFWVSCCSNYAAVPLSGQDMMLDMQYPPVGYMQRAGYFFKDGMYLRMEFKLASNYTGFSFFIQSTNHSLGLFNERSTDTLYGFYGIGLNFTNTPLVPASSFFRYDRWYVALFKSDHGFLYAKLYEKENSSVFVEYARESPAGESYLAAFTSYGDINTNQGGIYYNNYFESEVISE